LVGVSAGALRDAHEGAHRVAEALASDPLALLGLEPCVRRHGPGLEHGPEALAAPIAAASTAIGVGTEHLEVVGVTGDASIAGNRPLEARPGAGRLPRRDESGDRRHDEGLEHHGYDTSDGSLRAVMTARRLRQSTPGSRPPIARPTTRSSLHPRRAPAVLAHQP